MIDNILFDQLYTFLGVELHVGKHLERMLYLEFSDR